MWIVAVVLGVIVIALLFPRRKKQGLPPHLAKLRYDDTYTELRKYNGGRDFWDI
jgi:hypothetical protein